MLLKIYKDAMMWLWLVERMRIPHEVALFEDANELIEEIEDVDSRQ
jgi:hypothetical protein